MAINEDISAVRSYRAILRQEDYELHASITTLIAARTVLNAQRRMVRHLQHEGRLERPEAERLAGRIDRQVSTVTSISMPRSHVDIGLTYAKQCWELQHLTHDWL